MTWVIGGEAAGVGWGRRCLPFACKISGIRDLCMPVKMVAVHYILRVRPLLFLQANGDKRHNKQHRNRASSSLIQLSSSDSSSSASQTKSITRARNDDSSLKGLRCNKGLRKVPPPVPMEGGAFPPSMDGKKPV